MGLNKSLKQIKLENVPKGILPVKQMPVRTTFRLSKGGHDAIKYISEFYNINNTEVFDRLVSLFQEIKKKNDSIQSHSISGETTRKTYLINKSALLNIGRIVREQKTSRDIFVDYMATMLELLSAVESLKKRSKYEQTLKEIIEPFWEQGEAIKKKLVKELGKDDPVTLAMEIVNINIMNISIAIEDNIGKGTPIEECFPYSLR